MKLKSNPQAVRLKRQFRHGHRPPPGASPGQLQAPEGASATTVAMIRYGAQTLESRRTMSLADIEALTVTDHQVIWLQISGLADTALIGAIGKHFGLHRLILEDALTAIQRPKAETYGDMLFIVLRTPASEADAAAEQISVVLRKGLLITIDDHIGDCFDAVRDRLGRNGPIRSAGADYLAYALIDAVIDGYFPLVEAVGEKLDALDPENLGPREKPPLSQLHGIRHQLLAHRRAIWPLRDVLNAMQREADVLVTSYTQPYLRDAHDHVIELIDLLELYRETAVGLAELHVALVSVRMNDVMKLLTLISTIFIPLTFVAGVYGMNFDPEASRWNMPELRWVYGYPFALALMLALGLGLYWMFRRMGLLKRDEALDLPPPAGPD
jgi:magnesium transporter